MKEKYVSSLFILTAILLVGCSTTGDVRPYIESNHISEAMQKGVVYSLPKTVFEVKITYSLYDKVIWEADDHGKPKKTDKDGKPLAPKSTARVVVVDKPIEIISKIISDKSARFVFDPDSLNGFSKDTDITIDLTPNGLIKSTNLDVKDKTKDIISNITGTLVNLAKIAAVAGDDVVELTLVKDVKVSRLIDPSTMDFKETNGIYTAIYSDIEKSQGIFAKLVVPEVVLSINSPTNIKNISSINTTDIRDDKNQIKPLNGFPYRVGSSVEIVVKVEDIEVYDSYHMVAQAGGLALIPISAKSFTNITQGLSFGDDGSSLVKFSSKGTSRGEALSATTKETTNTIFTGIKDIDQAKIDKIKKEKELLDAESSLNTTESVSNMQAKIDLLKKEKELIDAELALKEAKKKQEASQ